MRKINLNFYLTILVVLTNYLACITEVNATCLYTNFQGWKDCFIKEKLSTNLNSYDIEVFKQAEFLSKVIELDKNQPEVKLSFEQYLSNIGITNSRSKILRGIEFYNENFDLVNEIAELYQVEGSILVALVGMESNYGSNMGKLNVIDSLATLTFEGRRKKFFEQELLKILQIAKNDNLSYQEIRGSWAGAMGQVQFMPSSYLNFAVDYDRDGKADIWNSKADALASAANYLKRSGWRYGMSATQKLNSYDDYSDICKLDTPICNLSEDKRLIFIKDNDKFTAFETSRNFEALMKWNKSTYFGLAVMILSDEISQSIN